jgi:hypothetical protein
MLMQLGKSEVNARSRPVAYLGMANGLIRPVPGGRTAPFGDIGFNNS